MFLDADSVKRNETLKTDLCIVGAGVAGIALAREYIGKNLSVCIIESGGLKPDRSTQSLYWGENVGHPYYPLDTARARFFGGTSHFWHVPIGQNRLGVRLRPLDPIDFEKREWVPYSGWPFSKSHLDPFYERAQEVLHIGPYAYEAEAWEGPRNTSRLPLVDGRVQTTMFQFGRREYFFDEYRRQLEEAENITTYLNANAVDIETTETARTVTGLQVATLGGNRFRVRAGLYVLAMGGLEIPRLLLLSNRVQKAGLGNQHDLVGRFFMEHHHLWSGSFVPADPGLFDRTGLYRIHSVGDVPVMAKLALAEDVQRREKLLNYCTSIHPKIWMDPRFRSRQTPGVEAAREIGSALRQGRRPAELGGRLGTILGDFPGIADSLYRRVNRFRKIRLFRLNTMAEQMPNPESRVTLATERDALGQNRVQLNWQPTREDMRSIIRAQQIIGEELRRAGLGRLYIELKDDTPPPKLHGGWHHMGTTRMHVDPKQGVVDADCRVHGIANLFIAGPSVFPTSGYANPVLTFTALTLRLADHVKAQLARGFEG